MRYAMIMAGGAGTRLWPLSRNDRPKQLLPFISRPGDDRQRSLLEIAADRLEDIVPEDRRYICTGEKYRAAVRRALPGFTDDRILGEPTGRDTVNAIGLTAAVLEKLDPDAVFAVFTADHLIEPVETFKNRVDLGFKLVEANDARLVTFSIKPTYPATGYGYVERGHALHGAPDDEGLAYRVVRFVEKPNAQLAQAYVEAGHFGWNSGMFVWKAATFLRCLEKFLPDAHDGIRRIQDAWATDDQQAVLDQVYPTLPKISVDYAVMERACRDQKLQVCTVLMDLTWLDVGSWPAYAETIRPDCRGNRSAGATPAVFTDAENNLVVGDNPGHTIAVLGAENLVVVHTPDATLVMPRDKAEKLKDLHNQLPDHLK